MITWEPDLPEYDKTWYTWPMPFSPIYFSISFQVWLRFFLFVWFSMFPKNFNFFDEFSVYFSQFLSALLSFERLWSFFFKLYFLINLSLQGNARRLLEKRCDGNSRLGRLSKLGLAPVLWFIILLLLVTYVNSVILGIFHYLFVTLYFYSYHQDYTAMSPCLTFLI